MSSQLAVVKLHKLQLLVDGSLRVGGVRVPLSYTSKVKLLNHVTASIMPVPKRNHRNEEIQTAKLALLLNHFYLC